MPDTHEAGFFRRMPAGGTDYRTPDPLLAAAVADGSHALAVEDRETEIRQAIDTRYAAWLRNTAEGDDDFVDGMLDAAVEEAAAREAALQARIVELEDRLTAAADIAESYSGHAEIDRILAALAGDTTEANRG